MMDKTKTSKVKQKNSLRSQNRRTKSIDLSKERSRSTFQRAAGVIQRIKPRKRDSTFDNDMRFTSESEEFDSDEHIENKIDWHPELDTVRMPHLLGPSATKFSPVPVEYQHLSSFPTRPSPFSCYQILIQCIDNKPLISYVPCNYYPASNFQQFSSYFHQNYLY